MRTTCVNHKKYDPYCEECKKARREYMAAYRRGERIGKRTHPPKTVEMGTRACYVQRCGHPECAQANREYQRLYMRNYRLGIKIKDKFV